MLDWPSELNAPMPLWSEWMAEGLSPEQLSERFFSEVHDRVMTIAAHLGLLDPPPRQADWLLLIYYLCRHWNIPAFHESQSPAGLQKRAGRKPKWTVQRRIQLFADVMSLVKGSQRMKARSACMHIARHPQKFLGRYSENGTTLHREFLRARHTFEEHEDRVPFLTLEEEIDSAIRRHSALAIRRRRTD